MEDIERWEKLAEWRGHTVATLESINNELKTIKESVLSCEGDLKTIKNDLTNQRIKTAELAAIIGVISAMATAIFMKFVLHL